MDMLADKAEKETSEGPHQTSDGSADDHGQSVFSPIPLLLLKFGVVVRSIVGSKSEEAPAFTPILSEFVSQSFVRRGKIGNRIADP